ncbi:MAG: monovalent cation/H(+) antiporter subunit G [Methanomicrobiales archaeon]|jgi:multicomponent Na+:H+ antiporter subunit G|nr:monovalent cation/H(+) antiporter subunit G [Methanomicrobiales archaeon]
MIAEMLIVLVLVIGTIFNALGVIGLLRFPDIYTRMHATTKATTFGSIFTSLAVVIYGFWRLFVTADSQFLTLAIHAIIAIFALAFTNAVSSHAIARAAHRMGVRPIPAVCDRLEEFKP